MSEFLLGALLAALLVAPLIVVLLAWLVPEVDFEEEKNGQNPGF